MKRSASLTFLMMVIVLLSGCGQHSQTEKSNKDNSAILARDIKKNQANWNQQIQQTDSRDVHDTTGVVDSDVKKEVSLNSLGSNSKSLIQGTIIDFSKIKGAVIQPKTKMSIKIEKVIRGDKQLEGKVIKTEAIGGFIAQKNYYVSFEGDVEPGKNTNKSVYVEDHTNPLPEIGRQVVLDIKPYSRGALYDEQFMKYLTQNDLTGPKAYTIVNQYLFFWIKDKTTGEYVFNNRELHSNLQDVNQSSKLTTMKKLTSELNHELA